MLPFQDISGMFDRSAGTGSPLMLIYVVWEFLLVLIVDYIARGRHTVKMSAPAAAVPLVLKGGTMVPNRLRQTFVATKVDLPRLETTPRLPAAAPVVQNQWYSPAVGYPYPPAPSYPAPVPSYPGSTPGYPPSIAGYPVSVPGYPMAAPVAAPVAPAPVGYPAPVAPLTPPYPSPYVSPPGPTPAAYPQTQASDTNPGQSTS